MKSSFNSFCASDLSNMCGKERSSETGLNGFGGIFYLGTVFSLLLSMTPRSLCTFVLSTVIIIAELPEASHFGGGSGFILIKGQCREILIT